MCFQEEVVNGKSLNVEISEWGTDSDRNHHSVWERLTMDPEFLLLNIPNPSIRMTRSVLCHSGATSVVISILWSSSDIERVQQCLKFFFFCPPEEGEAEELLSRFPFEAANPAAHRVAVDRANI